MAAFAKTATNLVQVWGGYSQLAGSGLKIVQMQITLSSQGGATNYIPATELGFKKILRSSMAQKSDDALAQYTCPSYDGSKLFFYNPAQATDANRDDPADVTGTFNVVVEGL